MVNVGFIGLFKFSGDYLKTASFNVDILVLPFIADFRLTCKCCSIYPLSQSLKLLIADQRRK